MSALLNTPPTTDCRLVMRIGLPTLGMYSHMLSPRRSVARPLSLGGSRNSATILSRPFFAVNSTYSFLLPVRLDIDELAVRLVGLGLEVAVDLLQQGVAIDGVRRCRDQQREQRQQPPETSGNAGG